MLKRLNIHRGPHGRMSGEERREGRRKGRREGACPPWGSKSNMHAEGKRCESVLLKG